MKYLKQFSIILAVSAFGELLNEIIPLPIPGSIYGIVVMFLLLSMGFISLKNVKDAAHFLIEIMPVMFIPAAVGLISVWAQLRRMYIPIILSITLVTVLVMVITGKVSDLIIGRTEIEK